MLFGDKCLELVDRPDKRYKVAGIDTPGIGKTTSTPLLIRKLLELGKTVVYLVRANDGSGWCYEFVSKDGNYNAEVYPERLLPTKIKSLTIRSNYFRVDPGSKKFRFIPAANFQPKLIIVASSDERHWGGRSFTNRIGRSVRGILRYFPVWSGDELVVAQPFIRPGMNKNQVEECYELFGSSVRNVFATEEEALDNLNDQGVAFSQLDEFQARRIGGGDVQSMGNFSEEAPLGWLDRSSSDYSTNI
jgi:hypothetical protein